MRPKIKVLAVLVLLGAVLSTSSFFFLGHKSSEIVVRHSGDLSSRPTTVPRQRAEAEIPDLRDRDMRFSVSKEEKEEFARLNREKARIELQAQERLLRERQYSSNSPAAEAERERITRQLMQLREQMPGTGKTELAASPAPRVVETLSEEERCREQQRQRGVYLTATDPCHDLDKLISNLKQAPYKFNKPQHAYQDEPFRFVLTITPQGAIEDPRPFDGTEGQVVTRSAPYAQHMVANLRGGVDFKIMPAERQSSTVTEKSPTVWEWAVTPLKSGRKTLTIEMSANLNIVGKETPVQLRTLYEEIEIRVSFWHLIKDFIVSIYGLLVGIATIIIAFLGIAHYRQSRHKKKSVEPPLELLHHHAHHNDKAGGH